MVVIMCCWGYEATQGMSGKVHNAFPEGAAVWRLQAGNLEVWADLQDAVS